MKKLIILLVLIQSFIFSLSAQTLYKKCSYENIHENAKGSYSIDIANIKDSKYALDGTLYPIFEHLPNDFDSANYYFSFTNGYHFYTNDSYENVIKFDKEGNIWFFLNALNMETKTWQALLCKFNPKLLYTEYFIVGNNAYSQQFAVSDDGLWVVARVCEEREDATGKGFNKTYLVHANNSGTVQLLLDDSYTIKHQLIELTMCFDSKNRTFLFYNHGWNEFDEVGPDRGLYELKPRGINYYPEDLIRHSSLVWWRFAQNLPGEQPGGIVSQTDLCKLLKHYCGANVNYDNLEVTLKHFKGLVLNGTDYSDFYGTDSNGNPLTEEAAVKFFLEKGENRINALCSDYTAHFKNLGEGSIYPYPLMPLEFLVQEKNSGKNVIQADANVYRGENTTEALHLFYNDEGVWGIRNHEDGTKNSRLTHVRDAEGNFIRNQQPELLDINLGGIYGGELPLFVGNDYLIFMDVSADKIYYLSKNILTDVSSYCQKNSANKYEMADFKKKHGEIEQAMKALDIYNSGAVKTEYIYKTDNRIFILLVVAAALLFILAVAAIVLNVRFKQVAEKQKYRNLKKDKKLIFAIQEKERGKISRDIHDSIIQDIRSIRLYSEMLKVSEDSLENKNKIVSLATDSVVKLRNICYNLTPAELATHEAGDDSRIELISIIQTLVTQFIEKTHVPCSIQIDENFTYPVFEKEVSQNIFRIIQEALTNIEKHSYATHCSVYIKNREEENRKYMVIYLSDDGIGCNINSLLSHKKHLHFGLQSMLDRIELIGGKLEFKSETGDGMEIIITVPINE